MSSVPQKNRLHNLIVRLKNFFTGHSKAIIWGSLAILIVAAMAFKCISILQERGPFVIRVDGTDVCYLESREDTENTIKQLVKSDLPEKTSIIAVDPDDRLQVLKAARSDRDKIITVDEAADTIRKYIAENDVKRLQFRTACVKYKTAKYVPGPDYIKDNTMLAGESKVVKKGKKGSKKVAIRYTVINGGIVGRTTYTVKIIDEGKKATIKKGTLGLPEGKDWKTYTGAPVFKNGKELITTAKKYMGTPYKYGGSSLKTGIDCVWFVKKMYAKYGIYVPLSHSGIKKLGKGISLKKAEKGDIVCYKSHVGLYVGNGKMIEANSKTGVHITKVNTGRVVTIRRVVK